MQKIWVLYHGHYEQIELELLCTGPKDLEPRNKIPTITIFLHVILYYKATGYFNLNSMNIVYL